MNDRLSYNDLYINYQELPKMLGETTVTTAF